MKHILWNDNDQNIPNSITDSNGEVVLSLCKICGKGECDLEEDNCFSSMTTLKQHYLSPRGHKVTIIKETEDNVTLMVYDNPSDPHEWTTTRRNFEKNYKPL